ncbi:MAG: methyl-accepting chemotaxis protein [Defluviitaleaceae bacterium]|nr:methyl-accepting chemotaxis protein [Defluviitaleaceae bacterium]
MNNPEVFLDLIKKYYEKQKKQNTELAQLSGLLEEVCRANEGILELNDQIVNYFNEIDTISRTYQILGFNARIEAAKLGENGRGFAIVANELRELATKTKTIASDSRDLIEACNENSEISNDKVNTARELLFKESSRSVRASKKR